ncbi:hypothetical protein HMPREF1545_03250 [Oscillibacter sp. KLE 1728]|nr:hypothetical protein HMPREF1545_03250 [Oscillibacter sp. KLE 1728]
MAIRRLTVHAASDVFTVRIFAMRAQNMLSEGLTHLMLFFERLKRTGFFSPSQVAELHSRAANRLRSQSCCMTSLNVAMKAVLM